MNYDEAHEYLTCVFSGGKGDGPHCHSINRCSSPSLRRLPFSGLLTFVGPGNIKSYVYVHKPLDDLKDSIHVEVAQMYRTMLEKESQLTVTFV